jgi:hypothetical protein
VLVGSVGWVFELGERNGALVSEVTVLSDVLVVGKAVDVVKGSYTNVQLD